MLNWWARAEVQSAKRALLWSAIALSIVLGFVLYARAGVVSALVPGAFTLWRILGAAKSAAKMAGNFSPKKNDQMTRDEALEVLGLRHDATKADINTAYKRLMAQCHPDKGGSDWMAAQLNEAKQVLTKK